MADVSLSTLPSATPTTIAVPGAPAAEGAADASTPFASLLTTLADPAALATKASAPLPAGAAALAAAFATPIVPGDPSLALQSAAPADAEGEATSDSNKSDPTAALAPDLNALFALIAPPPQIAPILVRAAKPHVDTSSADANAVIRPGAATVMTQASPMAAPSIQDMLAPASRDSAVQTGPTTSEPAAIAADRMAQAFAAIRAIAVRTPDSAAATTSAVVGVPSNAAPVMSASATAFAARAADTAPASTAPVAGQPAAPAGTPLPDAAPAAVATQADVPIQDTAVVQDAAITTRAPDGPVSPAGVLGTRRDPAPDPTIARAVSSAEPQRPAIARARKAPDTARIGDVRTDVAPARLELASVGQATAAPLADDPVARQLSIAHDGQWLDSLAKDIAGAGNTSGQLNFRLDPDHLGSLTVQLTQTADGASVRLTASTEAARTILADAQPRLVAEARAQGLTLRDATIETRTATPAPTPSASSNSSFSGSTSGGRSDQGGASAQLQQQSQGGSRQRPPDQPRQSINPAPRAATSTRSGADLYA